MSRWRQSSARFKFCAHNLEMQPQPPTPCDATVSRHKERPSDPPAGSAQLLDESRDQAKLLAEAKDEAARSSQLRLNTEASLVEQQTRITELSDKLRIASATLDMERQLVAAGNDFRELMAARQLHVIDVRDNDRNGNPSRAFGRVFLTEGKSLTFYAFDLNEDRDSKCKAWFPGLGSVGNGEKFGPQFGPVACRCQSARALGVES